MKTNRTLLKTAVIAMILGSMAFGPSIILAAPTHGAAIAAERTQLTGLFQMLLAQFGIRSVDRSASTSTGAKSQPGTPVNGSTGTVRGGLTNPAPDTATWGGGNRCQYGC